MDDHKQTDPKEPAGNPGASAPDYKAMYEEALANSRKWEARSKENYEKAKKFDEMADGKKTVEDRIAELEESNRKLNAEKERAAIVKSVAEKTGVSANLVDALSGEDEDTLIAQAKAIADAYKLPGGAPSASEAGKFPHGTPKKENEEELAFVRELFNQ